MGVVDTQLSDSRYADVEGLSIGQAGLPGPRKKADEICLAAVELTRRGYDVRVFLHGSCRLPWHCIDLKESKVQHLPRVLRRYPGYYTFFQKVIFALYFAAINPSRLIKVIQKRISRLTHI